MLHDSRIDLLLLGARGRVGSAFRERLAARQAALRREAGLDLRLRAAWDRRGLAEASEGLPPLALEAHLDVFDATALEAAIAVVTAPGSAPCLLIDCSACPAVADRYPDWLARGIGIVTANKEANARELAFYRRLGRIARQTGTPYRFETTVGAAIPLLGPLRDLALRGERVRAVQGVLSGSLSFLLERLHAGATFSTALAEAERLGYTEPDPGEDLRAADLVRKLLVLAREAGFGIEVDAVEVTPFSAAAAAHRADWRERLAAEDALWAQRIAAALAAGQRWVMLAEVDADAARVGLRLLPQDHPFARLPAGQNLVRIETELQQERPLWLGGPGAGPAVTAAGLLSDVIAAAEALAGRAQAESKRRSVAA